MDIPIVMDFSHQRQNTIEWKKKKKKDEHLFANYNLQAEKSTFCNRIAINIFLFK